MYQTDVGVVCFFCICFYEERKMREIVYELYFSFSVLLHITCVVPLNGGKKILRGERCFVGWRYGTYFLYLLCLCVTFCIFPCYCLLYCKH